MLNHFFVLLSFSAVLGAQTVSTYVPMTQTERWKEFTKETFTSPGIYFSSLGAALGGQLNNRPSEWGQGVEGYAHRTGYFYALNVMDKTIRNSSAAAFGHDVRYEPSKKKGLLPRSGYALSRAFVTRNREGKLVPYVSNFIGNYGSGMISTYMLPDRYDPIKNGLQAGHIMFASNAGGNLLREFGPDLKKAFRRMWRN